MREMAIALTATILVFTQFLMAPNNGAIILVGGGKIPTEAIIWLKQRALSDNFLVITCNRNNGEFAEADSNFQNLIELRKNNRWVKMLGNVKFVLPEDFEKQSLSNIGAIIIDGGDQWQYLIRLNGKAIQHAHELGIPIMGTSAGAMILGEHYFSAEKGTIIAEELTESMDRICLGKKFVTIQCLKGLIVDTHFEERKRDARLRAFVEKSGASGGLGIDEETALCIDNQESLIIGKGGVKLILR